MAGTDCIRAGKLREITMIISEHEKRRVFTKRRLFRKENGRVSKKFYSYKCKEKPNYFIWNINFNESNSFRIKSRVIA